MKITAIVTAAGTGSRFSRFDSAGKSLPKQFLTLKGKPVILYSLLAFQHCCLTDEIIVTAGKSYFDFIHETAHKNRITKLKMLVEGGKTRFESVRNAFIQINGKKDDIVIIHDAARPNITYGMIGKIINSASRFSEVIPGIKISETVKREKKGIITETLDRNNLWTVQTPQMFRYIILKKAYEKAGKKIDFTDEASLVEYAGFKVRIIEGDKNNIKITSSEDLKLLKKLM